MIGIVGIFFFSSRRRHTRCSRDWSSDVCSSDLALPNSRIILHQPMGDFSGQATDVDIHAKEILRIRERLNTILSQHTTQPLERIQRDTDRDFIMTATASKEYGLIDQVISKRE